MDYETVFIKLYKSKEESEYQKRLNEIMKAKQEAATRRK